MIGADQWSPLFVVPMRTVEATCSHLGIDQTLAPRIQRNALEDVIVQIWLLQTLLQTVSLADGHHEGSDATALLPRWAVVVVRFFETSDVLGSHDVKLVQKTLATVNC